MVLADVGTDLFRAVLQGAPPGAVYALVALGFVLTYKTSGVFNLAFGAQAYVSAVVYFKAVDAWGWGMLPAFVLSVLVLAPALGFVLEWAIFRHLRTAPAVATLVVCIGLDDRAAEPRGHPHRLPADTRVTPIGHRPRRRLGLLRPLRASTPSAATSWWRWSSPCWPCSRWGALFKWSAIGLRMRAVVESPRMTELNGISADRVSAFAWALSSFFAGLAGVLIAPRFNTFSSGEFFNIVVVAIAAAAVGQLTSLPRALAGGLGLGVLIALFSTFLPRWSETLEWLGPIQENVTPAIPFLVLFGVLVFDPALRRRREASDPLSGVDPPPVSQAVAARPTAGAGSSSRAIAAVIVVAVLARGAHRGQHGVAVPRHPGRDPRHRVPVDHGHHRPGRPDLAVPGRLRRDRWLHRLPAGRAARHVGDRSRAHRGCHRGRGRGRPLAAAAPAHRASGSPSPPWPSPTSSTR